MSAHRSRKGSGKSTGGQVSPALVPAALWVASPWLPALNRDARLVAMIAHAIGLLEANGQLGPFAVVLGQRLFLVAQTSSPALVLPQDRILPFLGGGPLLRSSTLDNIVLGPLLLQRSGVVVALGGEPVELVVATDVCVQFLQVTAEPRFVFRVCENMRSASRNPEQSCSCGCGHETSGTVAIDISGDRGVYGQMSRSFAYPMMVATSPPYKTRRRYK